MIHIIAFLLTIVQGVPITPASETTTEKVVETSIPRSNISRLDQGNETHPPEIAIAFVKTNGTTFGDNFANPYGTKLDLPDHKNIEETLAKLPEFKNFGKKEEFTQLVEEFTRSKNFEKITQDESKHGNIQKVDKNQKGIDQLASPTYEGKTFKPSTEEGPGSFRPLAPNFYNSKNYFFEEKTEEKYYYPNSPMSDEVVQKHIYVHVPPEDSRESNQPNYPPQKIKKEKHYKIVFIKAPSPKLPSAPPQPIIQKEEKTLIYILVKKPDVAKIFGATTVSPLGTTLPPKPEVYYISYNPKREKAGKSNGYLPTESGLEAGFNGYERKDDLDLEDVEIKSKLDDVTVS